MDDEFYTFLDEINNNENELESLSEKEYRELLGIEDEKEVTDAAGMDSTDDSAEDAVSDDSAITRALRGKDRRKKFPASQAADADNLPEDSRTGSTDAKRAQDCDTSADSSSSLRIKKPDIPPDAAAAFLQSAAVVRTAAALAASQTRPKDGTADAGLQTLTKAGTAAATTTVIGGRAVTLYDEAVQLKALQKALLTGSHLVASGKLSQSDLLLSKASLWKKLRAGGVSPTAAISVIRHKKSLDDALTIRRELVKSLEKRGEKSLLVHVSSDAFFSLKNTRTQVALQSFLASSKSGALQSAGSRSDIKTPKKLLFHANGASLSKADAAAARMLLSIKTYRNASSRLKAAASVAISPLSLAELLASADPNSAAGIRPIILAVHGAALTAKIARRGFLVQRAKPAGRRPSSIVRRTGKKKNRIVEANAETNGTLAEAKVAKGTGQKVSGRASTPNLVGAANGKGRSSARRKVRAIGAKTKASAVSTGTDAKHISAVSATKASLQAERTKAQAIAQTKALRQMIRSVQSVGKAGSMGARAVGSTAHVLFTPVRLSGRIAAKAVSFFAAIGKWLLAAFGATMIVSLLLIVIMGAVASFAEQQAAVAATAMLSEDETLIPRLSDTARGLSDAQKEEAKAIGEGTPQNPSVFYGHSISRYGHPGTITDDDGESAPGWVNGYKIYYTDIDGNINGALTSNIKDVLILAYVMMDGDFDSDPAARDALVADLWAVLNPGITWKESSIYTCPDGCDTFSYFCNSSGDYRTIDAMREEGVGFYGSIHPQTAEGCDSYSESYTDSDGESHSRTVYFCDGHEATVCYGHKDIDIFIRIGVMEDYYGGRLDTLDPADPVYGRYLSRFNALGGFTEDVIDWCKTLYGADWFAIYGTDPVSAFGITTVETLSEAEVRELVSAIEMGEGISGAREQAVAFAISQIGQIPYYWGGKATSGELPLMTNHGRAGSLTAADTKGRTAAGLDCYGFVQFVYWHALGMKIPTSSTSVWIANGGYGAREISASELKPGDMGVQNGHTGMFAGYENGRAVWVHCSGNPTNTVVMNGYGGFDHFYNVIGD